MPTVFISYSHDSEDHISWVKNFAYNLRENGIEVILDQDKKLGTELGQFMEESCVNADRVLMICTEAYVEKANTLRGGVGFEKLIINAELFDNLKTTKFVPVIRQHGKPKAPIFMATRTYINFSDDGQYLNKMKELLKDLTDEQVEPKIKVPPAKVIEGIYEIKRLKEKAKRGSSVVTHDEAIKAIFFSNHKDDWVRVSRGSVIMCTYKHDLSLRIEYRYDDEAISDFIEKWATKHPDPKASSSLYYLCYGSSLLDQQLMVSVDGCRTTLPAPDLTDLSITPYQYAFGKICDPSSQYDSYLFRSGIKVKREKEKAIEQDATAFEDLTDGQFAVAVANEEAGIRDDD